MDEITIHDTAPDFDAVRAGLDPGVYPAWRLSPPSGDDCNHLLVREDGSLGWCDAEGDQSEDDHGQVSTFSVENLCDDEDSPYATT